MESVEDVEKDEFEAKLLEICERTESEQDKIRADEERCDNLRLHLDAIFQEKEVASEQRLLEIRSHKGACLDRIEKMKDQLMGIMEEIKVEHQTIRSIDQAEEKILSIQQENARVRASGAAMLQKIKQGQQRLQQDMQIKCQALSLALERGREILDAITVRRHERESELDAQRRDIFVKHHDVSVQLYSHLFQTLADREDQRNQLADTLETHKYHFEKACKVANFPEVSRLRELMQRTQLDMERVSVDLNDDVNNLLQRYRAMWELERVLYQRFRYFR